MTYSMQAREIHQIYSRESLYDKISSADMSLKSSNRKAACRLRSGTDLYTYLSLCLVISNHQLALC